MSKKEKLPAVYKITNTKNGKVYIGSTHDVTARFKQYMTAYKRACKSKKCYKNSQVIVKAMVDDGWDNFKFKIVDDSPEMIDNDLRALREIELITEARSIDPDYGYNATMGGETGTKSHRRDYSIYGKPGRPKSLFLVDTADNFSVYTYLKGTKNIHLDLGIVKSSVPDAARRGNFIKNRYFIFFVNPKRRKIVAEFVKAKRDVGKTNGNNGNSGLEYYKLYEKSLKAVNDYAKRNGFD